MTSIEHAYRYSYPSAVTPAEGQAGRVELATSGGEQASPLYFEGQLVYPRETADFLRALIDVVHARYHVPAAMLQRILIMADPVVTCTEGRLRFEGFSSCCGVYARLDVLENGLRGTTFGRGTTNVDFNPPMLAALARVRESDALGLSVGRDHVAASTTRDTVIERRVPLPARWVRGFGEVQACLARMTQRCEIPGVEARRFLRALPKASMHRRATWITAAGAGLRVSQLETPQGVRVGGVERLRVLTPVIHHAELLRVYSDDTTGASAWEIVATGMRYLVAFSPEVWRGFSGEGQLLREMAASDRDALLSRVRAALTWEWLLDVDVLAAEVGAPVSQVRSALAVLSSRGLVGYDLAERGFFHRVLPFDLGQVERLQPRLRAARRLVAEGAVRVEENADSHLVGVVVSDAVEHRVRLSADSFSCTCPWYAKHRQARGECKHVLAVRLTLEAADV